MAKLQAEEPMIHLLHSNCEKLLKVAMGRLMKSKEYIHKKGKDLQKVNADAVAQLLEKAEFMAMQGQNMCKLVDALPEGLQRKSILGMRCFYKAVMPATCR